MPNVHLTPQMQDYIDMQVRAGAYANASEVVRAGMRMLMEQDGAQEFFRLKADLEAALAQVEAGEVVEFDPEAFLNERRPKQA